MIASYLLHFMVISFIPYPLPSFEQRAMLRLFAVTATVALAGTTGIPQATWPVAFEAWYVSETWRIQQLGIPGFLYQTSSRWGHEGIFVGSHYEFSWICLIISTLKEPKILRNRSFQNRLSPYRRNTDRLEGQFHLNTQNPLDFDIKSAFLSRWLSCFFKVDLLIFFFLRFASKCW